MAIIVSKVHWNKSEMGCKHKRRHIEHQI